MKFYRYEDILEYYGGVTIVERVFWLIRETPCGYWIHPSQNYKEGGDEIYFYGARKRWVSKTTRKRYAYPTKGEAMESFVARKRRQVAILTARLDRAKVVWADGSARLNPHNNEAQHLTKEAYDKWQQETKAPGLIHG